LTFYAASSGVDKVSDLNNFCMKAPKTFEFAVAKDEGNMDHAYAHEHSHQQPHQSREDSAAGWQAQCTHMPDMAIMERWWRIFAAGFGYALH
jgi:hypothetical protein